MNQLQVTKQNAIAAYKKADSNAKELLENLFGKEVFNTKIIDRVKTFEDACVEVGISTQFDFSDHTTDEAAYCKLKIIAAALNEGWRPDWDNNNQRKWWPWFYLNKPGFRFHDSSYVFSCTHSAGGSRLCFSSEELSNYAAKQFLSLYEDFIK